MKYTGKFWRSLDMARLIRVHPDARTLAHAGAARLLTRLIDLQSEKTPVHIALTGGTIGIALLAALNQNPAKDAVDWTGVHIWWSDERFLPLGHPDRNDTQARNALLHSLTQAKVHPVPFAETAELAATIYAADLPERMDVTLLGVGPDGHVASLFPSHPGLSATGRIIAVHNTPKPPSERVSFTMAELDNSNEVWLVVSGNNKATALRSPGLPAAQVHGRKLTLLLADVAAVS